MIDGLQSEWTNVHGNKSKLLTQRSFDMLNISFATHPLPLSFKLYKVAPENSPNFPSGATL
ncbi:MAG: hypothetical protein ACTS5A_00905 [Candidatus Hodgkinia cicadicola]